MIRNAMKSAQMDFMEIQQLEPVSSVWSFVRFVLILLLVIVVWKIMAGWNMSVFLSNLFNLDFWPICLGLPRILLLPLPLYTWLLRLGRLLLVR
jgi:hypothetical protein